MRKQKTNSQPSMTFLPVDKTVDISKKESVLDVALAHKIALNHSCGGMGSCTTCRVFVRSRLDILPGRTEVEQERADMMGFAEEERLACQLPPQDGLVVEVPSGAAQITTHSSRE